MEQAPKNEHTINQFDFDIRKALDSEEECLFFVEKLKELGLYGPQFLYCGFDKKDIGKNSSEVGKETIFCSRSDDLSLDEFGGHHNDNALRYALEYYKNPVIGVYDASKMSELFHPEYRIIDKTALIAVIRIKN